MTLAQIKNYLRKSTRNSEEEISLLLKHAERSGQMLVEMLHTNDPSEESIMCKFINHHTENQRSEDSEISQKEKAEFFLKLQLQRIEKKLIDIEQRVAECD